MPYWGPSCADYQLNVAHMLVLGPGAEAQFPHRDEDVWVHMPSPRPEIELASITALCDFTPEIGATRVVPGSHHWERDRPPEPHEFADAVMPAGSRVIYLGSTIHGAGSNTTTDQHRPAFHLSYMLGWLRCERTTAWPHLPISPARCPAEPRTPRLRRPRRHQRRRRFPRRSRHEDPRRHARHRRTLSFKRLEYVRVDLE